jgi:hypothetical protein
MITEVKGKNNFVDALATAMRYAVLTKDGRIQILIRPKPKQLRKRGQRGWQLFGTIDSEVDAEAELEEMIRRALGEFENVGRSQERHKKKVKS